MNSEQKLLLSDYLKDSTNDRLSIFVRSIDPTFPLSKANKTKLELLISDFKLDQGNKKRLKLIEGFVSPQNSQTPAKQKVKGMIPQAAIAKFEEESREGNALNTEEEKEYYEIYLRKHSGQRLTNEDIDKWGKYSAKIQGHEIKVTPDQVRKEEESIIERTFGDKTIPGTTAYKLLNNEIQSGRVYSIIDPSTLIEKLFRFSGLPVPYKFTSKIVGRGNFKSISGDIQMDVWQFGPEGSIQDIIFDRPGLTAASLGL